MATQFNKNYTELTNVNNGNQLQNGDSILGDHVNVALQNTAHFKDLTNNTVVRNAYISNNVLTLVLASKTNTGDVSIHNLELDLSSINGVEHIKENNNLKTTITNEGDGFVIKLADSDESNVYTFKFNWNTFEFEYVNESEGTTTITTYNLLKVPCFVKITSSTADIQIFINTSSATYFRDMSGLLRTIPSGTQIQATGYITEGSLKSSVFAVEVYQSYIRIYALGISVSGSSLILKTSELLASTLTIRGELKIS